MKSSNKIPFVFSHACIRPRCPFLAVTTSSLSAREFISCVFAISPFSVTGISFVRCFQLLPVISKNSLSVKSLFLKFHSSASLGRQPLRRSYSSLNGVLISAKVDSRSSAIFILLIFRTQWTLLRIGSPRLPRPNSPVSPLYCSFVHEVEAVNIVCRIITHNL